MWEDIISNELALISEIFKNNESAVSANYEDYVGRFDLSPSEVLSGLQTMIAQGDENIWSIVEVPWLYFGDPLLTSKVEEYAPIQKSLLAAVYNYNNPDGEPVKPLVKFEPKPKAALLAVAVGMALIFIWIKTS